MSEYHATQIPKPSEEGVFERCNELLWRHILRDPSAQLHGRRGQRQHGVDIVGRRGGAPGQVVGIQCRLKGEGRLLEEQEVKDEVTKALRFRPLLSEYIIATTAPDDARLQRLALELSDSVSRNREIPLKVQIFGWNSLEREVRRYPEVQSAFDPSYTTHGQRIEERLEHLSHQLEGVIPSAITGALARGGVGQTIDLTSVYAEVHTEQERQINLYAEIIRSDPSTALGLFEDLRDHLESHSPNRTKFRVAANVAACQLELGNEQLAAQGFVDAWDLDPGNSKAIANKAYGLLLQGKWDELSRFAKPRLESDPENAALAACYVHCLMMDETVTDPLAEVPETVKNTPEVAEAHVRWLMQRRHPSEWWIAAKRAHCAHPDSDHLREMYACGLLEEIVESNRTVGGRELTKDEQQKVRFALVTYKKAWQEICNRSRLVRGDPISVPINLMSAYRLLDQGQEAIDVGLETIERFPNENIVRESVATALAEQGQSKQALELIAELPVTPQIAVIRFNVATVSDDWKLLSEVVKNHLDSLPEADHTLARAAGVVAHVELSDSEERLAILDQAISEFQGDTRALIRLCQCARKHGYGELARRYFTFARSAFAGGDDGYTCRLAVAQEAMSWEEPGTTAYLLDGHVSLDRDSDSLRLLAQALVSDFPIRERALRFFDSLPSEVRSTTFFLHREGAVHVNRGVPKDAIDPFSKAYRQERTTENLMYLIGAMYRADDRESIESIVQSHDVDDLSGSSGARMDLAHVLNDFGKPERSIDLAYHALIEGQNNSTVVLKYLCLIIKFGQSQSNWDFDGTVKEGVWVSLTESRGEVFEALLGEEDDRPWGASVDLCNSFVTNALGLKRGESFLRHNSFTGSTETWVVTEVKPRWLHAFHHLSKAFSQRFPNAQGFASVPMDEGDVQPALDLARRHSEGSREHANQYLVNNLPIAFVAGDRPGGSIGFAHYLASIGEDLRVCNGSDEERIDALELIAKHGRRGVVLDALTAWHASLLDLYGVLEQCLGTVAIPSPELGRLKSMADYLESFSGEETMSLSYQDGTYFRHVSSAEEQASRLVFVRTNLEKIQRACKIEPLVVPDKLSELGEQLVRIPFPDVMAPGIVAGASRLLLSEDMMMRQLCRKAYGTKGLWLQAVMLSALEGGQMTGEDYVDGLVHLASYRHGHVSVNVVVLLSAYERDLSDELLGFEALCSFLGGRNAEPVAHISIGTDFVNAIWSSSSADSSRVRTATDMLFFALLAREKRVEWGKWAASCFLSLDQAPRAYLLEWCSSRSLAIDEIRAALHAAGFSWKGQ